MDEQMKKLLEETLALLKSTRDFAAEQVPLVIQELYRWDAAMALFWLGIISLSVGLALKYVTLQMIRDDDDDAVAWGYGLSALAVCVWLASLAINGATLLKIWLAPRLYLIERLSGMLKGN